MSIDRLNRVLWRVRSRNPGKDRVLNTELRRAIMFECGTDPKTLSHNRKILRELGWIKSYNQRWVTLTGKDLTES